MYKTCISSFHFLKSKNKIIEMHKNKRILTVDLLLKIRVNILLALGCQFYA